MVATRKKHLTVTKAAEAIGITRGRLHQLIRAGECQARKFEDERFPTGFSYEVPVSEVERLSKVTHATGRPRSGGEEKPL